MADRVLRVALTGGIATGKSACLRRLAALGVPVIEADRLAREVISPGTPGHSQVVARFGTDVVAADGGIDRTRLGQLVFTDSDARRDLEAIIHPLVYGRILNWLDALNDVSVPPAFGVADIPLLYETGHAADFDIVIVAACSPEEQLRRLIARDGLSAEAAAQRIDAQWPIARKRALADYVIDTSGPRAETDTQVTEIARRIAERRSR